MEIHVPYKLTQLMYWIDTTTWETLGIYFFAIIGLLVSIRYFWHWTLGIRT